MTRTKWRFGAVIVACLSGGGAYWLQPNNLALLSNPDLSAALIGFMILILNILANYMPSISGKSAGDR